VTAREVLDGIKAQLAADQSKTVHDAKFGDILRTGWCTYYFGADSKWHNARTGEIIEDLESLEEERQADDETSEWLSPWPASTVACLTAALESALGWCDTNQYPFHPSEGAEGFSLQDWALDDAARRVRTGIENALKPKESQ